MAATKLETSSAMVDVLTRAVTDAADLVSGLSGQVTQLRGQVTQLRGEVTQLRGIVMHKRGIVITLEQRSDAPDMSADEKADLEAELRVAKNELRVAKGELQEAKNELLAAEEKLVAAKAELREAEEKLQAAKWESVREKARPLDVISAPSNASAKTVEEHVHLEALSPVGDPAFLVALADGGLLAENEVGDIAALRTAVWDGSAGAGLQTALASALKARLGALYFAERGPGVAALQLRNSEVAFTGLLGSAVASVLARGFPWAVAVTEAATCGVRNSRGSPADLVVYGRADGEEGRATTVEREKLRPSLVVELGSSAKNVQAAAYAHNLAICYGDVEHQVPMATLEGPHPTASDFTVGTLTLRGVVVPSVAERASDARTRTTVPFGTWEYSDLDTFCEVFATAFVAGLSVVAATADLLLTGRRPPVVLAGANTCMVAPRRVYKWFRPSTASSRRINLPMWTAHSPAAEARVLTESGGSDTPRVLVTTFLAHESHSYVRVGHFVSLIGWLEAMRRDSLVHGDILFRNIRFPAPIERPVCDVIASALAALDDGAYFAAAVATAQAGKAAADALAEVLRLLANPCLEAVAASKSLLYAALADDADGVVVPVWQAVVIDYDLARSTDEEPRYPPGFVVDKKELPDGARHKGAKGNLPMAPVHDVFAVKALLEQTVPKDSGLLAGALHGAVALDAVPETHYCREMWKATRGIGRFDGDGSQWCTAALSALVGIPLDTRLEVQLDPSPKASSSPPTTPPK